MRLSDLIGTPVTTSDGRRLGCVREVRFVETGRTKTFVVDGLIVSRHAFGARLGLDRPDNRGLALLRALQRLVNRDAVWIPIAHVVAISPQTISVAMQR